MRLDHLVRGDHDGQVEGRKQCKRFSDGIGISEFDGLSSLTYWKGRFYNYARSNPELSGHRSVQVCSGDSLTGLESFCMCTFHCVPYGSQYLLFSTGGEYRDPEDKRGKHAFFCGIQLYSMCGSTRALKGRCDTRQRHVSRLGGTGGHAKELSKQQVWL